MHLHVVQPGEPESGEMGTECVRRSVDIYFVPLS